jgi:methionyl-tRNA formyltransferase
MTESIRLSELKQASDLRLIFAGTPDFAGVALNQLILGGLTPRAVLSQPDRPAGRGRKLQASPVKKLAIEAGIEVLQPTTLRDAEIQSTLKSLQPDLIIVVAYGLILPAEVLQIPRLGCWNIHASNLPRWRGAAPIQRAIEAGDKETGVCIMRMNEGLDTGPVLASDMTPISKNETGGSLHDRLADMGGTLLLNCINRLVDGQSLFLEEQSDIGVSYATKLSKSEAELNWELDAQTLERQVRAFDPWPVAWFYLEGERTRIWSARAVELEAVELDTHSSSGLQAGDIAQASSAGIDVVTNNGHLRLLKLQRPGGRSITAREYLNARDITAQHRPSNSESKP